VQVDVFGRGLRARVRAKDGQIVKIEHCDRAWTEISAHLQSWTPAFQNGAS
jgi:hypothetical protein